MLKVKKVVPREDFSLFVELSDGRRGVFDVKPYLDKGVFVQLKDGNYFKQVKPFLCGIVWPNEQDFSADTIAYELKETLATLVIARPKNGGEKVKPGGSSWINI